MLWASQQLYGIPEIVLFLIGNVLQMDNVFIEWSDGKQSRFSDKQVLHGFEKYNEKPLLLWCSSGFHLQYTDAAV